MRDHRPFRTGIIIRYEWISKIKQVTICQKNVETSAENKRRDSGETICHRER
jgi:hypothetical protein